MNRVEFFAVLQRELRQLPQEETANVMAYYTEYFDDAGQENEQNVINELGDPWAIAQQIKADYAARSMVNTAPPPPYSPPHDPGYDRRKPSKALWIVLAVFAAPIAIPLIIAVASVVFALVVALFSVVIALCAVAIALFVAGISIFISSFFVVPYSLVSAMLLVGIALSMMGVSTLLGIAVILLGKVMCKGVSRLLSCIHRRRGGKCNE